MASDDRFYELLGVPKDASVAEIKRAFRRKALAVHPDRNTSPDAHTAFQELRRVHDVLVDPDTRALYDNGGEAALGDDDGGGPEAAFWANAASRVSEKDIEAYERSYPGSPDEVEDLVEHYRRFAGNVVNVIDYVPFAEDTDLNRFISVWDEQIENGNLQAEKRYSASKKTLLKRAKRAGQKDTSTRTKRKSPGNAKDDEGPDSLVAMIRGRASQREQDFDTWADSLAEKYSETQPKSRRRPGSRPDGDAVPRDGEPSTTRARRSRVRGGIAKRAAK